MTNTPASHFNSTAFARVMQQVRAKGEKKKLAQQSFISLRVSGQKGYSGDSVVNSVKDYWVVEMDQISLKIEKRTKQKRQQLFAICCNHNLAQRPQSTG